MVFEVWRGQIWEHFCDLFGGIFEEVSGGGFCEILAHFEAQREAHLAPFGTFGMKKRGPILGRFYGGSQEYGVH